MPQDLKFQLAHDAAEQYDIFSVPLMQPFVDVLASKVDADDVVLDLACGTGYVARAVVASPSFSGRVAAADVNQPMVAIARRQSDGAFEVDQSPADQLPYGEGEFDIVVCQQGLQFFPDLSAALAEVRRVLRPGGLLAATAWAPRERSPYFEAQGRAFMHVAGSGKAGVSSNFGTIFGLDESRFAAVAESLDFIEVTAEDIVADVHLPPLPEFAARHLSALPFVAAIIEQDPQAADRIAKGVTTSLHNYRTPDGGATVPFASQLLCARKPGGVLSPLPGPPLLERTDPAG